MNIGGSKSAGEYGSKQAHQSRTSSAQHKSGTRNVARIRLASQQDDTEGGDDANQDLASPRVRGEVTEANDSYCYDYAKGKNVKKYSKHDVKTVVKTITINKKT